jgi:endonuclease IV
MIARLNQDLAMSNKSLESALQATPSPRMSKLSFHIVSKIAVSNLSRGSRQTEAQTKARLEEIRSQFNETSEKLKAAEAAKLQMAGQLSTAKSNLESVKQQVRKMTFLKVTLNHKI